MNVFTLSPINTSAVGKISGAVIHYICTKIDVKVINRKHNDFVPLLMCKIGGILFVGQVEISLSTARECAVETPLVPGMTLCTECHLEIKKREGDAINEDHSSQSSHSDESPPSADEILFSDTLESEEAVNNIEEICRDSCAAARQER
jgi:hypothetical protein